MQDLAKRWLKSLRQVLSQPPEPAFPPKPAGHRLLLEGLECRLTPAPFITTIAGTASYGYSGDGGPPPPPRCTSPRDRRGRQRQRLHRRYLQQPRPRSGEGDRNIVTVAGTAPPATAATAGRPPGQAWLPHGVAVDGGGNLFIADSYNDRIREVVKATGNIITVAGNGSPATAATAGRPPPPS